MGRAAAGRWGEDVAEAWYTSNGYTVLARNWRCPHGEIDLIVLGPLPEPALVFVEVKSRIGDSFGPPWEAVTASKQRRVRRAARQWLQEVSASGEGGNRAGGRDVRFDVVGVRRQRCGEPIVDVFMSAF